MNINQSFYVIIPTIITFITLFWVMKNSPQQKKWSRVIVVAILITLSISYIIWRSFFSLNFDSSLECIFSILLYFIEMSYILITIFQMRLILKIKNRDEESEENAKSIINGNFRPSVDIFIPTYNEPSFLLKRTIIGCQALDYENKKIYLLDDTQRPEIFSLAKELGCEYITRTDNFFAKAGNLNNALYQTSSDLIAVFDADFVPTQNFLNRTVGFFQDRSISLVQTNQSFYNPDPITKNLSLEKRLPHEAELFSRHYQVLRDGVGNAMCYGSSFVVRRSSLEKIGGFETESLSEDIYTSIKLSAHGYQVIYLDEKLSAGLSTENMKDHLSQQLRWTIGTIQSFFINANPLTIPGLRFSQRLNHIGGVLYRFNNLSRIGLLVIPIIYSFFKFTPIHINPNDFYFFLLPYYIAFFATYSWLNQKSQSYLMSDIYSLVHCFPLSICLIQTVVNPFVQKFNVTPKDRIINKFYFNWDLAFPMIIVFVFTLISLYLNFLDLIMNRVEVIMILALIWSCYNLLMISMILLVLLDIPKTEVYEWFNIKRKVIITIKDKICLFKTLEGITTSISEVGAEISLLQIPPENMCCFNNAQMQFEIKEDNIILKGTINNTKYDGNVLRIKVIFEDINIAQYRQLVKLLFCRPHQWQRPKTPGECNTLWLLLTAAMIRIRSVFTINLNNSK